MRTQGMAAVLEVLGELRAALERYPPPRDPHERIAHAQKIEALWTDLTKLLDEERQAEVSRYDAWLQRIEDDLNAGGDTVKLVELGVKVADRRAHTLKLDARTVIQPRPMELVFDIETAAIESEKEEERILRDDDEEFP